jgi:hypothetical protein
MSSTSELCLQGQNHVSKPVTVQRRLHQSLEHKPSELVLHQRQNGAAGAGNRLYDIRAEIRVVQLEQSLQETAGVPMLSELDSARSERLHDTALVCQLPVRKHLLEHKLGELIAAKVNGSVHDFANHGFSALAFPTARGAMAYKAQDGPATVCVCRSPSPLADEFSRYESDIFGGQHLYQLLDDVVCKGVL